ncbi:MAG: trypsin-like serine protease [Deltaproteobacteria bacterium]|nr:trypsin-like serine protease [Deltaproteobacteria bacterium]
MSRLLAVSLLGCLAGSAHAETSGLPDTMTPEPLDRIADVIGGTAAPAGKWPDAVAVLGNQGSCTGTLIAPDVVLTAGHCAEGMTRVIANTTNYNSTGGTQSTIKTITAYPNWETTYDIAVIVLNTPITTVPPRKIGTACTFASFAAKPMVHLVGFGSTDVAGTAPNTLLNEVTTQVTDPDCTAGNGCQTAVAPGGEFVAGGNNRDSCFGDSGGPVYLDTPRGPVVIGAVSRGVENAANPCGGGGIYVRTDKLVQWIETTAGKAVSKDLCSAAPPDEPGTPDPANPDPQTPDPTAPGADAGDITGGCSSAGGTGSGMLFTVGLGLALLRRRRRDAKAQD